LRIGVGMLADLILVVHFCIAGFITAGFVLIPLGAVVGWRWVRNRHLRLPHVWMIAIVAFESLVGIACPLTVWEDMLRGAARGEAGFVGHWLGRLLYWDVSATTFTLLYVGLVLLAIWLWRVVPPDQPIA
jgi:hypothetical protein